MPEGQRKLTTLPQTPYPARIAKHLRKEMEMSSFAISTLFQQLYPSARYRLIVTETWHSDPLRAGQVGEIGRDQAADWRELSSPSHFGWLVAKQFCWVGIFPNS